MNVKKVILIFLALVAFHPALLHSQNAEVHMPKGDMSIDSFIKQIEGQTNYLFIYSRQDVNVRQTVHISGGEKSVIQFLGEAFRDGSIVYTFKGDYIVLTKKGDDAEKSLQKALIDVNGKVVSKDGDPIMGAAVLQKGTTKGVVTDLDGKYSIRVPVGIKLEVSSLGYETVEFIAGKDRPDITLPENSINLEGVVFVGYGTMKKKDLTGSIATVKASNLEQEAPRSMEDYLRGSVAGLTMGVATDVNGTQSVQIRGINTLSAGSAPLYVVDGVIYPGSKTDINPADIERIDVLKDASSVAIYGAKASNGVISITTKKGSDSGKPKVTLSANVGLAKASSVTPLLGPEGFIQLHREYRYSLLNDAEIASMPCIYDDPRTIEGVDLLTWYNYNQSYKAKILPDEDKLVGRWLQRLGFTDIEIENYLNGVTTDWDDYYFPLALQQDYTVSMSNKTKNSSYYASISYADREGTTNGLGYNNIRGRINLETSPSKWITVGVNSQFAARDGSQQSADLDERIKLSPFTTNVTDDLTSVYAYYPSGNVRVENPFFQRRYQDKYLMDYDLFVNMFARITLPFGFEFQTNYSPRLHWYQYANHNSSENPLWGLTRAQSTRSNRTTLDWQLDNTLSWKKEFGDHRFEVTLAQNAEQNKVWFTHAKAKDFAPSDVLGWHYLDAGVTQTASSKDTYETGDALMARLFYAYHNRYMLTATIRRDGYSAFGMENPYGYFPSMALGWIFSEEKWMKKTSDWLNYGKLRLSYGVNGNRDIGTYAALATLATGQYEYIDPSTGAISLASAIYIDKLENSKLKWEKTAAYNIGLDYALFNNFIDGSVDAYMSKTTDLLVERSLPNVTGFETSFDNLGEIHNKGFEFVANVHPIKNNWLKWDSSFTFDLTRRKIAHLYGEMINEYDDAGNVIGTKESDDYENGWFIGHDPNEIYSYEWDGVWQEDEADKAAVYGLKPGDFRYVDQNKDGTLNADDKIFWGKYTTPRFQFSWRNEFEILRNISFGMVMYAKIGQWGAFNNAANTITSGDFNGYDIPRWTKEKPLTNYARLGSSNVGNYYVNKSFLRMENIYLSYSVPKNILQKLDIQSARFTLSVRNPFVLTKWYFGDVEGSYSVARTFNLGINISL